MLARVMGVFKLDTKTFDEIEGNTSLTLYAAIIVGLVALVSGVGTGLFNGFFNRSVVGGFFGTLISTILGWVVWSVLTWFVGTRFFGGQATIDEMLRVIGFAYLPLFLSIIPCVGSVIGAIWALVAGFIAVRQGLDLDNTKTFMTVGVGFLGYLILTALVNVIF
ncbi:MAG: hypothetical protein C3F13_18535 [Anaerolineales bacterium]|nr:YIP1 family protein [Anaerolineae bacterium]PWB49836.1 MAG: hypothetical protein C3F13_18535 [Anaerolineales bacterium]